MIFILSVFILSSINRKRLISLFWGAYFSQLDYDGRFGELWEVPTSGFLLIICICRIVIFFSFGRISSCSHLCPKRRVGWAQFDRRAHVAVWARSVQCVARGKPFKLFWPWAHLRQIPGFPQHPPGDWVSASLIPAYARKIWMQTRLFCSRRGYTFISLFLYRAPRYDPAAQQRSSPLAAVACNCMRVWLLL